MIYLLVYLFVAMAKYFYFRKVDPNIEPKIRAFLSLIWVIDFQLKLVNLVSKWFSIKFVLAITVFNKNKK